MTTLLNCASKILNTNSLASLKFPFLAQTLRSKHYQLEFEGLKNHWPQWSMMKDQRRRMTQKEYGAFKLRYNAVYRADILPPELRNAAIREMGCLPPDVHYGRCTTRCSVTSRGKGNVLRFKLSRFIFRHLADYNKMAGVQRGFWT